MKNEPRRDNRNDRNIVSKVGKPEREESNLDFDPGTGGAKKKKVGGEWNHCNRNNPVWNQQIRKKEGLSGTRTKKWARIAFLLCQEDRAALLLAHLFVFPFWLISFFSSVSYWPCCKEKIDAYTGSRSPVFPLFLQEERQLFVSRTYIRKEKSLSQKERLTEFQPPEKRGTILAARVSNTGIWFSAHYNTLPISPFPTRLLGNPPECFLLGCVLILLRENLFWDANVRVQRVAPCEEQ